MIGDLDIQEHPVFFVYQLPFHRRGGGCHREWLIPAFKRKYVTHTLRFEKQVVRLAQLRRV